MMNLESKTSMTGARLTFWGAAQMVTGSMHLLETKTSKILLDCGLYQGKREESHRRNARFPFSAEKIDAVLLSHAAVADAAVIPSPDEESGEVPKAFVVLKSPVSTDEILDHVARHVAPYKKIRRIEIVEAIPKSPSGKILRRVLIEREREAANGGPGSTGG